MTKNRVSAGVPDGGQFSAQHRTDSTVSLNSVPDLADLDLGRDVEAAILTAAASHGHAMFTSERSSQGAVDEIGNVLGAITGKHVVVVGPQVTARELLGNAEQPGLAAQANGGILVLSDATELSPTVIDALRPAMETGKYVLSTSAGAIHRDADFQLVILTSRCACGNESSPDVCTCTPFARRRRLSRLSGPLLDRIGIRANATGAHPNANPMTTAAAQAVARDAFYRSAVKLLPTGVSRWRDVPNDWFREPANRLPQDTVQALDRALERGQITMRGYVRTLRSAWALAMIDGVEQPTTQHLARALNLRAPIT